MFSPCLWGLSRDKVKTSLTLQIIARPSLSMDCQDTKPAFGAAWREECGPRVISEFSWLRESVQGEKQRGESQPPGQHSGRIPSIILTLSNLEDHRVSAGRSRKPHLTPTLEKWPFLRPVCKNPGNFFGNFPS